MPWNARLELEYQRRAERTVAHHTHEGPLRILQTLYPEGDGVAHNVMVHPPSGLVAGDTLEINVRAAEETHGLITTPGATRFYRSEGEPAVQRTRIALQGGARLEWLPLEAIAYSGCVAENHLTIELAPSAELIAWDVTALGLPASQQPFAHGSFLQHLEVKGHWLEHGRIDALDARLMDGPLGLSGHRCLATLFFACGDAIARERRELALALASDAIAPCDAAVIAGVTAPDSNVIVVRAISSVVEPAMQLLKRIHAAWRPALWNLAPIAPRLWAM